MLPGRPTYLDYSRAKLVLLAACAGWGLFELSIFLLLTGRQLDTKYSLKQPLNQTNKNIIIITLRN